MKDAASMGTARRRAEAARGSREGDIILIDK
jgi:hypothetical protein